MTLDQGDRHNLPSDVSSFVGRQAEIGALRRLLGTTRLLTLTGSGGVGKTRLALHLAASLLGDAADAVWLVELAPLADPTLVPQAVAQAVGLREERGRPLLATLAAGLRVGRVLLLLDNCEHLVAACAQLAERLLRACPGLRILATSRELLGVPGEVNWRVPSLSTPVAGEQVALEDLAESEAVQLFVERAQAARPGFVLAEQNAPAVWDICRRLDGIPLAIELAAARVRMMAPDEIAARLGDRFRLLTGGSRTAPPRQQTLRAAIDWSYDLLTPPERCLLERLSVFHGGFGLQAVEAVCADTAPSDPATADGHGTARDATLGLLSRLVDRSLVVLAEPTNEEVVTRYRLLETLLAYGEEKLQQRGEAHMMRERHADWLVGLAMQAARALHGPDQAYWLRWAEREHDNVRVALHWALEREDVDTAMRVGAALWWSWALHLRWSEGQAWLERVLALPCAQSAPATRADVLLGAGMMASFLGDLPTAQARLAESVAVGQELGDAFVFVRLGASTARAMFRGEQASIRHEVHEILEVARSVGHTLTEVLCLETLAVAATSRDEHDQASRYLVDGERLARATGDIWSLAKLLMTHGDVERSRGEHASARKLYAESQARFDELGLGPDPGILHNLGYVTLAEGDVTQGAVTFREALNLFRRIGDWRGAADCLVGAGCVLAAAGQAAEGARLFGAGEAALHALSTQLWAANRADYRRWLAFAKAGTTRAAFATAWSEGRALPLDQAVWVALAALSRPIGNPGHLAAPGSSAPLTRREDEVVELVAQGLTNRQIAARLYLSERTAQNHVQHILTKLNLSNRSQIVAWVASRK